MRNFQDDLSLLMTVGFVRIAKMLQKYSLASGIKNDDYRRKLPYAQTTQLRLTRSTEYRLLQYMGRIRAAGEIEEPMVAAARCNPLEC